MEGKRVESQQSSNSFMLNEEQTQKISQLTSIKTQTKVLPNQDKSPAKAMVLPKNKNQKSNANNIKSSLITNNTPKKVEETIMQKKALDQSSNHTKKDDPVKPSKNNEQKKQKQEEVQQENFEQEQKEEREEQKQQKSQQSEKVEQQLQEQQEQRQEEQQSKKSSQRDEQKDMQDHYEYHEQRKVKIVTEGGQDDANEEPKSNNFAVLSRMTCSTIRSTMQSCVDYLQYVFSYYCKLTYSFNKKTTFSQISSKLQQMTISSFMIFCQDFKIKGQVQRQNLIEIFKRYASFQKYLNIDQFHKVVQGIADLIYSSKTSEHQHIQKDLEKESNYKKMLKFLSLHNSKSFIQKMNSLGSNARVKNSKGTTVGNSKKYTFKLTPNNGRSEQQIYKEVQERAVLRKEVKDKNIQLHKENKTNKNDSLFANSQLKKQSKHLSSSLLNNQTNESGHYYSMAQKGYQALEIRQKYEAHRNQYNNKSFSTYHHSSQVFNHKREASYTQIFKLKTRAGSSNKNMNNKQNVSQSKFKTNQNHPKYSKDIQRLKVNQVISLAKKSLLEKGEAKEQPMMSPTQSFRGKQIQKNYSLHCESSQMGKIKKQLALDINLQNIPRKSAQLREAEIVLKHQIKQIQVPFQQSQLRLGQRQFLRASLQANKQNSNDLRKLNDVLGFDAEDVDEYLQKHYELEKHLQGSSY